MNPKGLFYFSEKILFAQGRQERPSIGRKFVNGRLK